MATGILKVDGHLPERISVVTSDGLSHSLSKLSDSDGRVLWEASQPYKCIVVAHTNWGGTTKFGLDWEYIEPRSESSYSGYKVGSYGVSSVIFQSSDLVRVDKLTIEDRTSISGLFLSCQYLKSADIKSLTTHNVVYMNNVFNTCSSLTSIDLSGWDVSNVTSMQSMFQSCSNVLSIDLSGWDVSNVLDMSHMIRGCLKLKTLYVDGWSMNASVNVTRMLYGCSSALTIYARNCSTTTINKLNEANTIGATIITE